MPCRGGRGARGGGARRRRGPAWRCGAEPTRDSGNDERVLVRDDAVVLGQGRREELGKVERGQVRGAVPVAEAVGVDAGRDERVDVRRRLLTRIGALGGEDEAPRRTEAGDEALVGG